MQPYLFLASVGPVQEFIASARRSRDLWFGSQLLSELSRAAALTILGPPFYGRLIFPAPAAPGGADPLSAKSVANRILAALDGTAPAAELGAAVEAAVRARLAGLRDTTFTRAITWDGARPDLHSLAGLQVDELPELFWVAAPLDSTYPTVRERLELLIAAVKSARVFGPSPVHSGLRQPKSSLEGSRESVIPEERFANRNDTPDARRDKANRLYRDYHAGRAERLSGVDLLKRLGFAKQSEADFPSTSHFAALPFLTRELALGTTMDAALARYVAGLEQTGAKVERLDLRFATASSLGTYDASILFEERLAEEVDKADLPEARGYLADFFAATTDGRRPEPYYALLLADGDNMGKAIDAQTTPEAHIALSQALDRFADSVRELVERKHGGALIYSGGDDVMAFLPLHTVLQCAKELADRFGKLLASFTYFDEPDITTRQAPTLSVGIAVAHHIEPLADALRLAREAEKVAKAVPGKDALAIIVSKRSGADRQISGRWSSPFFDRLTSFITWHQTDTVPDGAAYELLDLHRKLAGPSDKAPAGVLATAIAEDALRIFKRKRGLRGDAATTPEQLAFVRAQLGLPAKLPTDPAPLQSPDTITVRALANELIVAREFARSLGELPRPEGAS